MKVGARIALFFFLGWLVFRLVSDWPRGVMRTGAAVEPWMENLSYVGLLGWILPGLVALVSIGKPQRVFAGDPILRSHLLLVVFQLFALGVGTRAFGQEGLVAGAYIWLVSLSFLLTYSFGLYVGQRAFSGNGPELARRSAYLLTFVSAPTVILAILQIGMRSGIVIDGVNRVYGGTSSPNVLGALLLVQLMLLFSIGTRELRIKFLPVAVAVGIAFVGAFSLSGFVSLAFAAALFWLVYVVHSGKLRISPLWIGVIIIAISTTFYLVGAEIAGRFAELDSDTNSLTWRTATWRDSIVYLQGWEMELFGGGLGFDHLALPEEPHNEWLRVVLEMGFVGLLVFVQPFVRLLLAMKELLSFDDPSIRFRAIGVIAATAGLCLWATVDSVLRTAPSALFLWGAAGLLVGNARALAIARLNESSRARAAGVASAFSADRGSSSRHGPTRPFAPSR